MPLVIMCGLPCSGKSVRARQLKKLLEQVWPVDLVSDDDGLLRNEVYTDAGQEKQSREKLKSDVARLLSRDRLVILDAPNYIKGCRYELYCLVRGARTNHCIVQVLATQEQCEQWNAQRPATQQYIPEVMTALAERLEAPDANNRWDRPLVQLSWDADDAEAAKEVENALTDRRPLPPHRATQNAPLVADLYERDQLTRNLVQTMLQSADPTLPPAGQLHRLRRQFLAWSGTQPLSELPQLFNQYVRSGGSES
uniref:Protein KTI12 homolog n=1 Tax=Amblyomma maculatum TaxID=34609 RepID=G3MMG8_AMBMU